MSKKKKKEKITYIDDGRTIADMSGVGGGKRGGGSRGSLKEQKETFFKAMRMMFVPMLIVMGFITIAYLIAYLML